MWKDLSMSQRAEVIQLAIKNGMRDLNQIRSFYDDTVKRFDKGGKISDEEYYATMEKVAEENNPIWNKQRIAEGGKPLSVEEDLIRILNDNSYDYRGFYNKYPPTAADANSHWTDEFKTAYHPTFSDQSKFSGKKSQYNPYGYRGGHWVEETFFPEIWQTADSNKFLEGGPKRTPTVEELKARVRESEERLEKRKREEAEYRRKYEAMSAEEKAALHVNPSLHGEALVSALDSMAKVPITGEAYSRATEKQREKDLEKWHETKNILEGATTAAELLAAGYGVGRGLLQLGKMGAKRMGRTTLETALEEAVKRASKYQGVMNGIGTGVDVAQLTDAVVNKNTFDTIENAVEAGAGTAGIIGATDKFRNMPFFGRNINTIDNILDATGYGAAAWDIVKQLPPLSGALEHIKEEGNSNNKSKVYKKKSLGGSLIETANYYPEGGPKETYNVGYIPEVTIEAKRTTTPYTYYDPWSGRYKGIGIGGKRIEYGEGFNPEGSILLPDALAYENKRLERAKQDDLNHTQAFAENIKDFVGGLVTAPMFDVAAEPIGTVISKVASKVIKPKSIMTNATKMTPKQWTAAQDAAIARGDMAEAQRLRDLHFKTKALKNKLTDENGNPVAVKHYGNVWNVFDPDKTMSGTLWTANEDAFKLNNIKTFPASDLPTEWKNLYINMKNPIQDEVGIGTTRMLSEIRKGSKDAIKESIRDYGISNPDGVFNRVKITENSLKKNGYDLNDPEIQEILNNPKFYGKEPTIAATAYPNNIKLADAVTYDNNGVRIPLGERDNFNVNDIRYSWLPWFLGGGITAALTGVDTKATGGFLTKKSRNKVKKY